MKLFCATLSHETNRFSPVPTDLASYREFYLHLPSTGEGAHYLREPMEGVNLYDVIRRRGHDVVCGLAASAQPGRPTNRKDFEFLRDELLDNLRRARPVQGVLLFLHGAQVADGYDDCEGHLLERIREIVGKDVPIGAMLDLHANVTASMLANADLLLACKEYPHWDFEDRAHQLLGLMERTIAREIRPVMELARAPMLGTYFTTQQPMRAFVDALYAMERQGEVLAVSVCHGFAPADIEEAGASVLVVTEGDRARARRHAETLAAELFALREKIKTPFRSTDEALAEAAAKIAEGVQGPVVIADAADNAGGGAPGDSTFLLQAMLRNGVRDAALAMIFDPAAVQLAMLAGVGARLPLRIGGKTDSISGPPLDLDVNVIATRDDAVQVAQNMRNPLGPAVAIEVNGIEVVLNSIRQQTFTPECFTEFGIDPRKKRLLVVKGRQHFHEHFAPFAGHIIYSMAGAHGRTREESLPYRNIPRPVWPLDPVPFERFGRRWD